MKTTFLFSFIIEITLQNSHRIRTRGLHTDSRIEILIRNKFLKLIELKSRSHPL